MPKNEPGIEWDMTDIKLNVKKLPAGIGRAIGVLFQREAVNVQDYARSHAPWTDRTGNARNGLFAVARSGGGGRNNLGQFQGATQHEIVLYHTVPYGIWLEVRFAGKNAIINPTIQHEGPRIMSATEKLLQRMVDAA